MKVRISPSRSSLSTSSSLDKTLPVQRFGIRILLPVFTAISLSSFSVFAEEQATQSPPAPDTSFKQQYEDTQKALSWLNSKLGESIGNIKNLTQPDAVKVEIERMMVEAAKALDMLADNGTLAAAADAARTYIQSELRSYEADTQMEPDQREFIVRKWKEGLALFEDRVGKLNVTRQEFVRLVMVLQSRRNYMAALKKLENVLDITEMLKRVTDDIQRASDELKKILRNTGSPGT